MGLAGVLSAAGDIGGGLVSGAFNAAESAKARHWQEKMYDQRHQREVNDLRAAGLNPILSAGASPGGVGGAPSATMPDLGGAVGEGISTALAVKNAKADLDIKAKESHNRQLDVEAKQRMYDWLDKNPQWKDMYYAGMLAHGAGMNPNVMTPVMTANSGNMAQRVRDAVDSMRDWVFGPGADHRPAEISKEEIRQRFGKPKGGE